MSYGVIPTGFERKPLALILSEIEAQLITEFGPNVVQTPQSPLGQLNGLFADFVGQLWENLEDVYQSYDPDQAESTRLDILGKMRLLQRQAGENDEQFRQAITNVDRARNDIQDLARAIVGLPGVTYGHVFVNDGNTVDENGLQPSTVAVAVLGGDDEEIVAVMRSYVVPGISTYGNVQVTGNIDGFCRSAYITRPILIPVTIEIKVKLNKDNLGCPPPSLAAVKNYLMEQLAGDRKFINGEDVTLFKIRNIIESGFPSIVEVRSMNGARDGALVGLNQPVEMGFIEMATFAVADVTIVSV